MRGTRFRFFLCFFAVAFLASARAGDGEIAMAMPGVKSAAGAKAGADAKAELAVQAGAEAAEANKLRIVSMNYCIDFVLSRWQNPHFEFYPVAEHNGRIEQVMRLEPDMIIAGQFNSPIRINNFRNNGLPVAVLDEPNSFAGAERFYRELAALLQQPELAAADVVAIANSEAAHSVQHESSKPTILAMQVNQWSFGGNNLLNELFQYLGLENLAARNGDGLVKVGLEDILQWQPDILMLEGQLLAQDGSASDALSAAAASSFALANLNLMHKSLRNYQQRQGVQTIYMPREISGCMAQRLPEAIAIIEAQLQPLKTQESQP
ncbi:hypothetical protein CWE08_09160 [Aliidiomarina iranensis]|uniref:Fe/B12 periplasmic-binding domain-containing protein n=1 Tax=Aliidiomarina iranensis TaxID=1434071 RepID=A0A432VTI1_9GAMM|nr:ABC transporter substrate-binding protein [Aliidiomarina iranensis]RUO19593.1 hypothetical protein CWE08_09160 [Aliidiomarina iranensis]